MQIKTGTLSKSLFIRLLSTSTGLPVTDVEHDSAGIEAWYRREGGVKTTFTPVALASASAAYASGGIEHISDGLYRIDVPNAMLAVGATYAHLGVSATGVYCEEVLLVELQTYTHNELYTQSAANGGKMVHYEGGIGSGTHGPSTINMTAVGGLPAAGAWRGCSIGVYQGAGVGQTCIIKDWDGTDITIYGEWDQELGESTFIRIYTSAVIPADILEKEMKRLYSVMAGNRVTPDPDDAPGVIHYYDADDVHRVTSTVDQDTGDRVVTFEE
jgi:hypothetical protein